MTGMEEFMVRYQALLPVLGWGMLLGILYAILPEFWYPSALNSWRKGRLHFITWALLIPFTSLVFVGASVFAGWILVFVLSKVNAVNSNVKVFGALLIAAEMAWRFKRYPRWMAKLNWSSAKSKSLLFWDLPQDFSLLGIGIAVSVVSVPRFQMDSGLGLQPNLWVWALGLWLGQIFTRQLLVKYYSGHLFENAYTIKRFYDFWTAPASIFLTRSKAE